jgi:hypothetical protein
MYGHGKGYGMVSRWHFFRMWYSWLIKNYITEYKYAFVDCFGWHLV